MRTPRRFVGFAALIALVIVSPGSAADPAQTEEELLAEAQVAEEAGASYARLRHLEGTVSLRRGDEVFSNLVVNDPIAPGDVLTTDPTGRSEIQLADGSVLKLDNGTELYLLNLSDGTSQIENTTILQLAAGSLIVRADEMDSNEKRFQIDTDAASIFLLSEGVFRIDAREGGSTLVASRRGVAEVMAREISTMVRSGERVAVRAGAIPGETQAFNTRIADAFDRWADERDAAFVRHARVDEQVPIGVPEPVEPYVSELSYYGHWFDSPAYGWVWRPVGLASDWQPYYYGHWAWSPAGMIWVSYEPWGWAPFHYGRWEFLIGTGWVWIPGHVFSGAYVAWSVSPGYFGWCPLGYYDYPVSFHHTARAHRSPWMYIRGHHLYERRVHNIVIRDHTMVRDIEQRRVIVRGRPAVPPARLRRAPRITEEFHRTANVRPDLRLADKPVARRMPFHENERQRLVVLNNKKSRGHETPIRSISRGTPVPRPGGIPRRDGQVTVPKRPRSQAPAATRPPSVRGTRPPDPGAQNRPRP
ncbi:MAG TPA: DUF6600 domain-containing protein, partial [Candidatus Polarisedimenticolia bacterium]|nr:DUF6600 domain-containing protein [Candidatus Polarisedimenticolia bacterium]